ncbi:MAG: protein kinase [Gammaproteobacteria bacterium]|nr:protein kinase [Gammaproteobacteria bacterium]
MSTLPEGTVLGKYLIIRHLGSGGMADVYEAEDSRLGRRVALKVLPPELARNPQFIQRFESEVRKAASLNHGGIVPVFDFGLENGTHYYSMRLLTHGSLRNRIDEGLDDQEALSILRDMADALGHAHSRQPPLVHRDVKPENILFDEQGRPLLTDFGIAKAMDGNRNLTATGVAIGSALYMSPEQARGKKDLDGRADLYSLGTLFYEMLMKVPPYDGEDQISIIFKHVTEPIPQFPEPYTQYQDLLDAMMAKNPAQRVASARDLVALVDPLLPQRPTRGNAGTRTTGQTQGVGVGAISGSVELERIEREQAAARAAEQQRLREEQEAAERRAAEEERARQEALERQRAADEAAARQRAEAERIEREQAAARAAEQQRLREEQEAVERRAAEEERARQEALARQRAADEEAARQRAEAERIEREQAAARAAEQQRLREEQEAAERRAAEEERARQEALARQRAADEEAARQRAEAERIEREQAEARAAEQQRRREEQEAAERRAAEEERARQEALARQRAADEEAARQRAEAERIERARAAQRQAAEQDAHAALDGASEPAFSPSTTVVPPSVLADLSAPRRPQSASARRGSAVDAALRQARDVLQSGYQRARALPRGPLLGGAAAGVIALSVAGVAVWNGTGHRRLQQQIDAALAQPDSAAPAATVELLLQLDAADREALLVPGGPAERYFLARSEAAAAADAFSDERVAALAMLRKANLEIFTRPNRALAERIDSLSEPLYQLLDTADRSALFSLSAEEPSTLRVLRQLAVAGDDKRLERRFRADVLRKFDAAIGSAKKKDLPALERVLGDIEVVYGADPTRRAALQARNDEVGEPEVAVSPNVSADDDKLLAASERLVDAALAGNKLDDARSEILKLRKANKLGSERAKLLADKVASKYLEQARSEIDAVSVLKDTPAAIELKAALLANIRQLSRRVDIGAVQNTQRLKAELIQARELSDTVVAGSTLTGEQAVQAGITLDLALTQLGVAAAGERAALKARFGAALEKLRRTSAAQAAPPVPAAAAAPAPAAVPAPAPAAPALSGNDPCTAQKSCTDTVAGQSLRAYRLGASAPFDTLFIQEQEVSAELYSIVMGVGMTSAPRLPVTGISADDARRFAEKLSALTGHTFRLPTADEWQTAAREIRPNVLATANCAGLSPDGSRNPAARLNNVDKQIGQAKGAVNIIGNAAEIVTDKGRHLVAGASFQDAGADCSPNALKPYAGADPAVGFRLLRVVK